MRGESGKKQLGHKIGIIFCIGDMEYFGRELYTNEDPQNSLTSKLFYKVKGQLDRLLKKLKFTKETIEEVKNIVIHGWHMEVEAMNIFVSNVFYHCVDLIETQSLHSTGYNGKIYAMYYDIDLEYYFVFETCQYWIDTVWISVPESLAALKGILHLKVCLCLLLICWLNFFFAKFP